MCAILFRLGKWSSERNSGISFPYKKKQEAETFLILKILIIKCRLKGQVLNEQASIGHAIQGKKRNESTIIREIENRNGILITFEGEKQSIVYDFYKKKSLKLKGKPIDQ